MGARELGTRRVRRKHQRQKRRKSQRRRKRRKKNLPLMKSQWNLRRKILWMLCQREPLIWRNGKDSILTMMKTPPSPGSGSILITKITPSGEAITNTMTSSLWCSCHAISLVECSSAWRNSRKMLLHPVVCSARTTIPPSVESGSSRGKSWLELSEDWKIDYASYDWKKLDSKSDECKAQVAQYWKWEGNDAQGRPFNQGKILK